MQKFDIISQDRTHVTVRMTRRTWNRLQKLQEAQRIARSVGRAYKQAAESDEKGMDLQEALKHIERIMKISFTPEFDRRSKNFIRDILAQLLN